MRNADTARAKDATMRVLIEIVSVQVVSEKGREQGEFHFLAEKINLHNELEE